MGFFSVFLGILSLWIWIQSEAKEEKQKKGNDREANADAELTALSSFSLSSFSLSTFYSEFLKLLSFHKFKTQREIG